MTVIKVGTKLSIKELGMVSGATRAYMSEYGRLPKQLPKIFFAVSVAAAASVRPGTHRITTNHLALPNDWTSVLFKTDKGIRLLTRAP